MLRGLWRLQTFVCVRGVCSIVHIYTSVLEALGGPNGAPGGGDFRGIGAGLCRMLDMNIR